MLHAASSTSLRADAVLAGRELACFTSGRQALMQVLLLWYSHVGSPDGGDGQPVPQVPQVHALGSCGAGVAGLDRLVCQLATVSIPVQSSKVARQQWSVECCCLRCSR